MSNWAEMAWILTHGTQEQKDAVRQSLKEGIEQAEELAREIEENLRLREVI